MIEQIKPFDIPKSLVFLAYKRVKENRGGAGIDNLTIEKFDQDLSKNLYKLWNRLTSGSYFPPAVKACDIIKAEGGTRTLGIPTVSDRIAQEVVRSVLEPELEKVFDEDSYGYRPNKSALDAIGQTRKRCFDQNWLIEFDIKGMFDNIDHNLLMKAVRKHTANKWVLLYIQRWLDADIQLEDGTKIKRLSGVPQGDVVSPILSNLFMHYSFDVWMRREYPSIKWARYADDGVIHCVSKNQAQLILSQLEQRLKICKLEIKHTKTKIIYCQDGKRKENHENVSFTFLGYEFRKRLVRNRKDGSLFVSFTPTVSKESLKKMRKEIRGWKFARRTNLEIEDISRICNPILRGWFNYYGKYHITALEDIIRMFNRKLRKWFQTKYKKLSGHKTKAAKLLERIAKSRPNLFVHWKLSIGLGQ